MSDLKCKALETLKMNLVAAVQQQSSFRESC